MPCDTVFKRRQTIQQRAAEVRKVVTEVDKLIAQRRVLVKVGPQGAVAFAGLSEQQRDDVTDACIYRRLMADPTTSALTKAEIARAELLAGRSISKQTLAHGHHSHDGGKTWHHGH